MANLDRDLREYTRIKKAMPPDVKEKAERLDLMPVTESEVEFIIKQLSDLIKMEAPQIVFKEQRQRSIYLGKKKKIIFEPIKSLTMLLVIHEFAHHYLQMQGFGLKEISKGVFKKTTQPHGKEYMAVFFELIGLAYVVIESDDFNKYKEEFKLTDEQYRERLIANEYKLYIKHGGNILSKELVYNEMAGWLAALYRVDRPQIKIKLFGGGEFESLRVISIGQDHANLGNFLWMMANYLHKYRADEFKIKDRTESGARIVRQMEKTEVLNELIKLVVNKYGL